MSQTLSRFRTEGEHAGTSYEVVVDQWEGGAYVVAEVRVDGLPPRGDDDHSFESLDGAFAAGIELARHLIDH